MSEFESSRFSFRRLVHDDISQEYLDTLNDKNYMRFSRNISTKHTFDSQTIYLNEFEDSRKFLFGIWDKESNSLVGVMNGYIDFYRTRTVSLGFLVFKKYAGTGVITESLISLTKHLEVQLPGYRLIISTRIENIAMQNVALKCSFLKDDTQESNGYLNFSLDLGVSAVIKTEVIPDFIRRARKIGVAAFDAGGAEQLIWILGAVGKKFSALVDGPAKKIFDRSDLDFVCVKSFEDFVECDLIVTGSGWMSDLEISVLNYAKLNLIPTFTVLDHWVNYPNRFKGSIPNLLGVTNWQAYNIATDTFPGVPLFLLPDLQICYYREKIFKSMEDDGILVLSEPLRCLQGIFDVDVVLLKSILAQAFLIGKSRKLGTVTLRLHPSQHLDSDGISSLLVEFPEIIISDKEELLYDLFGSAVVLGFNSYGLYIAAMCGIESQSYFKGLDGHWSNVHDEILKVKE